MAVEDMLPYSKYDEDRYRAFLFQLSQHGYSRDKEEEQYPPPPAKATMQYVSPLSAADMVALATSLLADPDWGPFLVDTIYECCTVTNPRILCMYAEHLGEVGTRSRRACPHLAAECAEGVALALLPLGAGRTGGFMKAHLWLNRFRSGQLSVECTARACCKEALAAFFLALEQRRCAVQVLTIRGDAFGTPAAAAHLGSCLNINSTIRQLSIRVRGFCWTAFSHALTSNATLRRLSLEGDSYRTGKSSHVGATLAHPHKLPGLEYVFINVQGTSEELAFGEMEGWGTMLKHNSTITELELRFSSRLPQGGGCLVPICEALLTSTTLQKLTIGMDPPFSEPPFEKEVMEVGSTDADMRSVASMLSTNRNLRYLDIIQSGIVCNAIVLDQGLSRNSTLEELHIFVDATGTKALMTALSTPCTTPSVWPHLHSLTLRGGYQMGNMRINFKRGEVSARAPFPTARALGDMLASNRTLISLCLADAPYSNQEWAATILPQLATNRVLKKIDLFGCSGVDGGLVYDSLLDLLESNTSIRVIDLHVTPLHTEGKAGVVEAMIANKEYGAALKNVPHLATTSCRLVLCGYPFAGKSTLLQTMIRCHSSSSFSTTTPDRTRGIDIKHLVIDDLNMWVWDFAGQREFHPLQDFIFPTGTSVHIITIIIIILIRMITKLQTSF